MAFDRPALHRNMSWLSRKRQRKSLWLLSSKRKTFSILFTSRSLNKINSYKKFYPDGALKSDSYGRMATDAHFSRVKHLLDNTKGKIIIGGETDAAQKFVAPTIVTNVDEDDVLMDDEIFGPILPILTVNSVDEAISFINAR